MRLALVTNIHDGKGLFRDAQIVESLACEWGHSVDMVDFRDVPVKHADVTIHFEVFAPSHFSTSDRHWLIPNPEWWHEEKNDQLTRYERVLCKTKHAQELFASLAPRVELLGFESVDYLDPDVEREPVWIHVAGGSTAKGTTAVINAWEEHQLPYWLLIVGTVVEARRFRNARISHVRYLPFEGYRLALNRAIYHLQPSLVEGWGHVLHESLSVGGVLVTTDAAPMNEIYPAVRIPAEYGGRQRLATLAYASSDLVAASVDAVAKAHQDLIEHYRTFARKTFLEERIRFRARLRDLLDEKHP